MKLKIASWNIGEDERNEGNIVTLDSYDEIIETCSKYEIDILAMQEAITGSKDMDEIGPFLANNSNLKYHAELEYAPSHINLGSNMGVVTTSKCDIEKIDNFMFDNPGLVYEVKPGVVYNMHNKGMIITEFKDINLVVINMHGFPFFAFKRDATDFIEVYQKIEDKVISYLETKDNVIFLGDLNDQGFDKLFPRLGTLMNSNISENTYTRGSTKESFQLDYILTSKKINVINNKVIDNSFDHKMAIIEIEL